MKKKRNQIGTNVPFEKIRRTSQPTFHGLTPDQVGESICADMTKAWETFAEHIERCLPRYEWLRDYFKHKRETEVVCGCLTWAEYCENKLGKCARAVHYAMHGRPVAKPKQFPETTEPAEAETQQDVEFEIVEAEHGRTEAVEEAVRCNLNFTLSAIKNLSIGEKVHAIDDLVSKLRDERGFIAEALPQGEAGDPLFSVQEFGATPWKLLDEMIGFYCPVADPRILDATVNKGRIWGDSTRPYIGMDIDPTVEPGIVGDDTAMPFRDASFDIIVYDPPHVGDQGKSKTKFATKYGTGITSKNSEGVWGSLAHTYPPFLTEAKRVLRPDGVLLVKLIDHTHSATFQFATAEFWRAALATGAFIIEGLHMLPRRGVIMDSKWKRASHPRQNHCTWMIFRRCVALDSTRARLRPNRPEQQAHTRRRRIRT
jgi:SAM-dependent methyltransferase